MKDMKRKRQYANIILVTSQIYKTPQNSYSIVSSFTSSTLMSLSHSWLLQGILLMCKVARTRQYIQNSATDNVLITKGLKYSNL